MRTFRSSIFASVSASWLLAGSLWFGSGALLHAVGPAKVRVMVTENMATTVPSKAADDKEAPAAGEPKPAPKAGGKPSVAGPASPSDAVYTHSTAKSFNVRVSNLTNAPLDVTVKTTILGKDVGGKHETVTEKALENKLTVVPGKSEEFKTEDVVFTHTMAHRAHQAPAKGGARGRPAIAPMEPASGHAYLGYKVEVFAGAELVGSAESAAH